MLARSVPEGPPTVGAAVKGGCAAETAGGRVCKVLNRDCKVGPSSEVMRFATLAGLERPGIGAGGIDTGGTRVDGIGAGAMGGTPKAGGGGGNGVGGALRWSDWAWKTISAAMLGSTSGYSIATVSDKVHGRVISSRRLTHR